MNRYSWTYYFFFTMASHRYFSDRTPTPGITSTGFTPSTVPSTTTWDDTESVVTRSTTRLSRGNLTSRRPRTSGSISVTNSDSRQVLCAVSESRGLSPTVGLAVLNLECGEAIFCQLCDSHTYVKTINKLNLYLPTEVLIVNHSQNERGSPSTLVQIIEHHISDIGTSVVPLDRKYWSEQKGIGFLQKYAYQEDLDELQVMASSSYYAICSMSAVCTGRAHTMINSYMLTCNIQVFSYTELFYNISFPPNSIRFKCTSSDGAMMIDVSSVRALELIQNLQQAKSKDCLLGHLNHTQTPMGARMLRSSILQPLVDLSVLSSRHDALDELTSNEILFRNTRHCRS